MEEFKITNVVKVDAYGHGAVKIASVLQKYRVTDFEVSNILEAIELRESGVMGQILSDRL